MTTKLTQAVALITGGAKGLGRTLSNRLLEKGSKVIVADINADAGHEFKEEACAKYGDDAVTFLKCNVTDSKELSETFEEAKRTFGRLDIVCNNAGIMTLDPYQAKMLLNVNLTAVIEGTYKGIELMSRQGGGVGGVVVNVASAPAINLMFDAAVYSVSKQAVISFTRLFNELPYLTKDDVRVNCIAPYFYLSDMVSEVVQQNPTHGTLIEDNLVDIEDVGEGFMQCVVSDKMNGEVIIVAPNKKIFEMRFGPRSMQI